MLPLDRQLLDRTCERPLHAIVEQLAGLNAQTKRGPVVGLWTRTGDYNHQVYLDALRRYDLVRANLMRGTVHLVTRRQYLSWRACLQPVAERMVVQFCRGLWNVVDHDDLLDAGRELLMSQPGLTRSEIGSRLVLRFPRADPKQLGFAIRMLLPVVELADSDPWSSPRTAYVLAETAFGAPLRPASDGVLDLARSFLAAFGPASAADFSYWSGLSGASAELSKASREPFRSGRQVIYDADPITYAQPREAVVLPEFDNVFFCRKNDPELASAKRRLIYPPAKMYGSVLSGRTVVAHWSSPPPGPARTDWQEVNSAVAEEWITFTRWYAAMHADTR
jgi:hypothetical protein